MDTLNITKWAEIKEKEARRDIDYYISQGVDKAGAKAIVPGLTR